MSQEQQKALLEKRNKAKKDLLYKAIDASDFYTNPIQPSARSWMNVTFRLGDEALEKAFLAEAQKANMVGLAGHRSVGGIRASIYNAMGEDACQALADLMADFAARNG